jgi:hypothetical protein
MSRSDETMPAGQRKLPNKLPLHSAIAFAEGMDRVDFSKEI